MNALTNLSIDLAEAKFAAAVAAASDWTRIAKPVILAWFKLDEIAGDLTSAAYDFRGDKRWNAPKSYDESAVWDARSELKKPMDNLYRTIESIREDCINDAEPPQPASNDDEAGWDAHEEFCEALEQEVPSVAAAIDAVGETL